jgi:predicted kinase
VLVVISGLPGTGKSAVAGTVADQLGAVHLSIDVIEDALLGAGLPSSDLTGVAAYEATRASVEQNLLLGRVVVVDAVNDSQAARDTWRSASSNTGTRLVFILLSLNDPKEHRRRLEGRGRRLVNIPEPAWEDVMVRAAQFEPWVGDCQRVSADGPVTEVAAEVMSRLPAR